MDIQENILFETTQPPFIVDLKRIMIVGISLNLIFAIFYVWSWTRFFSVFGLFAFMDLITFYLPAVTRKYIITERCLYVKSLSGVKEIPFSEIGGITAAKGKILVASYKGRTLTKINEILINPADRAKFKDILFEQMEKSQ
ncbi:hypothetical protein SPSYN_01857 [Sporotomaculum syntrophicum]|uniref:Uncharacterized protein n=1 Tax=Sporotomaculum syntrophicum TaxID=182264 RepID=A0A9D2WRR2_9FIRM|nr:hypothetical protein [Sporotomaculum syntrophicum]KAF1085711.1 hypothetical protein SPSYN_01857 [Sporotomaculum syntrophicum]